MCAVRADTTGSAHVLHANKPDWGAVVLKSGPTHCTSAGRTTKGWLWMDTLSCCPLFLPQQQSMCAAAHSQSDHTLSHSRIARFEACTQLLA